MSDKIQNHPEIFERKETLVQMFVAHKHFPCKTSPSTAQRFIRVGISTPHGRYKLETAEMGGKRFTSEEAIERFIRVQQRETAPQTNVVSVPASSGMTKSERKQAMKRLGLRPQSERPQTERPEAGAKTGGHTHRVGRLSGQEIAAKSGEHGLQETKSTL